MAEAQTKAATQSHDAAKTPDKKRHPAPVLGSSNGEPMLLEGLVESSFGGLSVERHAALLADTRFSGPANAGLKGQVMSGLQSTCGNAYVQRLLRSRTVQAEPTMNAPVDQHEEIEEESQTKAVDGPSPQVIQRQEEEQKTVQPKVTDSGVPEAPQNLEERINAARSTGQNLPDSVRGMVESHLGHDFREVRIHTDAEADRLSRELGARAFTTGQDVFFGAGTYQPESEEGQCLISHELTHVVQQSGSSKPSAQAAIDAVSPKVGELFQTGSVVDNSSIIHENRQNVPKGTVPGPGKPSEAPAAARIPNPRIQRDVIVKPKDKVRPADLTMIRKLRTMMSDDAAGQTAINNLRESDVYLFDDLEVEWHYYASEEAKASGKVTRSVRKTSDALGFAGGKNTDKRTQVYIRDDIEDIDEIGSRLAHEAAHAEPLSKVTKDLIRDYERIAKAGIPPTPEDLVQLPEYEKLAELPEEVRQIIEKLRLSRLEWRIEELTAPTPEQLAELSPKQRRELGKLTAQERAGLSSAERKDFGEEIAKEMRKDRRIVGEVDAFYEQERFDILHGRPPNARSQKWGFRKSPKGHPEAIIDVRRIRECVEDEYKAHHEALEKGVVKGTQLSDQIAHVGGVKGPLQPLFIEAPPRKVQRKIKLSTLEVEDKAGSTSVQAMLDEQVNFARDTGQPRPSTMRIAFEPRRGIEFNEIPTAEEGTVQGKAIDAGARKVPRELGTCIRAPQGLGPPLPGEPTGDALGNTGRPIRDTTTVVPTPTSGAEIHRKPESMGKPTTPDPQATAEIQRDLQEPLSTWSCGREVTSSGVPESTVQKKARDQGETKGEDPDFARKVGEKIGGLVKGKVKGAVEGAPELVKKAYQAIRALSAERETKLTRFRMRSSLLRAYECMARGDQAGADEALRKAADTAKEAFDSKAADLRVEFDNEKMVIDMYNLAADVLMLGGDQAAMDTAHAKATAWAKSWLTACTEKLEVTSKEDVLKDCGRAMQQMMLLTADEDNLIEAAKTKMRTWLGVHFSRAVKELEEKPTPKLLADARKYLDLAYMLGGVWAEGKGIGLAKDDYDKWVKYLNWQEQNRLKPQIIMGPVEGKKKARKKAKVTIEFAPGVEGLGRPVARKISPASQAAQAATQSRKPSLRDIPSYYAEDCHHSTSNVAERNRDYDNVGAQRAVEKVQTTRRLVGDRKRLAESEDGLQPEVRFSHAGLGVPVPRTIQRQGFREGSPFPSRREPKLEKEGEEAFSPANAKLALAAILGADRLVAAATNDLIRAMKAMRDPKDQDTPDIRTIAARLEKYFKVALLPENEDFINKIIQRYVDIKISMRTGEATLKSTQEAIPEEEIPLGPVLSEVLKTVGSKPPKIPAKHPPVARIPAGLHGCFDYRIHLIFPAFATRLDDDGRARVMLHEFSHKYAGTTGGQDEVYQWQKATFQNLTADQAALNADSYAFFAFESAGGP